MNIETINGQRVLTPDENMWLYNENECVISDKVYLGIEANETEWIDITDERKQEFEVLWYEDVTNSDMTTEEDYQKTLAEFRMEL